MTCVRVARLTALVLTLAGAATARALADSANLANRIPPGANTIVFINVDSALDSKLGVKEGWRAKLADAYATKPLTVPPNARQVVLASWIELAGVQPLWEVSLIQLSKAVSMQQIAKDENGFTEMLDKRQAAWSPANAYFVRMETDVLGVVCPADRQFASRWAAQTGANPNAVSPFLRSAIAKIGPKTDYLFALDLENAPSEKRVRRRLADGEFACLADKQIDANKFGAIIASVKGLRLTVDVDEDISGECVIEFGRPVSDLAEHIQPLLLELLDRSGAMIDDFKSWKMSAKDATLQASGKLSSEGFRHLCSIVNPPSPTRTEDAPESAGPTGGEPDKPAAAQGGPSAAASKKYYQAVSQIIDGIGKQVRTSSSMNKGATYIARDARRIDRLPILNVDPELVQWGTGVSSRLIEVATGLGVGGFTARARTEGVLDPGVNTGYDDWEGGIGRITKDPNDEINRRNARRERAAQSAEQRAQTLQQLSGLIQEIEASRATIRAAMTEKYKAEF